MAILDISRFIFIINYTVSQKLFLLLEIDSTKSTGWIGLNCILFNPILLGGEFPASRLFQVTLRGKMLCPRNFSALSAYIGCRQCTKFHWNILTNEGRRKFSGTDPGKITNSHISIFAEKVANLRCFANFFRRKVSFDVLNHHSLF